MGFRLAWVVALVVVCGITDSSRAIAAEPGKLVAAADQASQGSAATGQEISRWIDELSHDSFTVRQTAASQLLAAGMAAREPLLAIVEGPDPETRAAARRLVALIDQTEFHRRLEAFAADTDGRQGLTLPGWEQYQKLVGSDPPVRALFVDMQRHEGALISATLSGSIRTPSDLLEPRLLRLLQWQNVPGNRSQAPALGSYATMLFLGTIAEIGVSDGTTSLIETLLQRPPIQEMLRPDHRQEAVRRLAVGWVLNCPTKSENILLSRLSIISATGLEDALPLPLAVIAGGKPYERVKPATLRDCASGRRPTWPGRARRPLGTAAQR